MNNLNFINLEILTDTFDNILNINELINNKKSSILILPNLFINEDNINTFFNNNKFNNLLMFCYKYENKDLFLTINNNEIINVSCKNKVDYKSDNKVVINNNVYYLNKYIIKDKSNLLNLFVNPLNNKNYFNANLILDFNNKDLVNDKNYKYINLSNINKNIIYDINLEELAFLKEKNNLENIVLEGIAIKEIIINNNDFTFTYSISKTPFLDEVSNLFISSNAQVDGLVGKLNEMPEGSKRIVLGLSAGVDSTLALLASISALKKLNLSLDNLICVLMPSSHTSSRTIKTSRNLSKKLGFKLLEIDISKEVKLHLKMINHKEKDITYENVQARIRTLILMSLANKYKGFVIGTSDLSEIALGFMTYGGDQLSMYSVNSGIPKTYAISLINYYKDNIYKNISKELEDVVNAKVTPELLDNQITENIVGLYEINDFIMYYTFAKGYYKKTIEELLKIVFELSNIEASLYMKRFFRLYHQSEFKRETMAKGPKIFSFNLDPRKKVVLPKE